MIEILTIKLIKLVHPFIKGFTVDIQNTGLARFKFNLFADLNPTDPK